MMFHHTRLVLAVAALCAFDCPALGQRVWVVAPAMGPGVDFTVIQSAVAAAADGDTILVRSGSYAAVEIRAKALVLVGEDVALTPPFGGLVTLAVADLRASQSVVVRGFTVTTQVGALAVTNCNGPVLVDSCSFTTAFPLASANVAEVTGSLHVTLARCAVRAASQSRAAAGGLSILGSTVSLHDCTITGAPGTAGGVATSGTSAATVLSGVLIATRTSFTGGSGAPGGNAGGFCIPPGNGGHGVLLQPAASAYLVDCLLTGGLGGTAGSGCLPGTPGLPIAGSGTATVLTGPAPSLTTNSPVRMGQMANLTFTGPTGSGVWLLLSARHTPFFLSGCNGTLHPDLNTGLLLFVGFMSAGGLQLQVPVPPSLGLQAVTLVAQAGLTQASGCYVGAAAALVLLDSRY
jgi:hypothetical protein